VCELIEAIAYRRGFGAVLAESSQAARFFPPEARRYLMAVKDLPQSDPHDVRYIKSFALGIAVASRGADHLRNRPTLDILPLPDEVRRQVYGFSAPSDPTAYEGKAAVVAWHEDIYAVADCLGVCKFITRGFNSPNLLGYSHFADLILAATGLTFTPEELRQAGANVVDLERSLNAAFGRTRLDDTLPDRMFDEPLPARAAKGHRIERDSFERMLDEYYAVRGWDDQGRLTSQRADEIAAWL
jgi:aldehyde:ferredoxin oxidoreductase